MVVLLHKLIYHYLVNNLGVFAFPIKLTIRKSAGLPNITGEVVMYGCEAWFRAGTRNGCFYWVNQTATSPSHHVTPYEQVPNLQFNASWVNNVYGASNTVTPLSQGVLWCMKY